MNGPAYVVMAKAPVAGEVKTRLIPLLGAQGAVDCYRRLLRRALDIVCAAAAASGGQAILAGTPSGADWAEWTAPQLRTLDQGDGDLGARMRRLAQRLLDAHPVVAFIGADCPSLSTDDLVGAAQTVQERVPVAFIAAEDGGYVLLAVRQVLPALFDEMPWSTAQLLQTTCARLTAQRIDYRILATRYDIDCPEDYRRHCRATPCP